MSMIDPPRAAVPEAYVFNRLKIAPAYELRRSVSAVALSGKFYSVLGTIFQ